MKTYTHAPAGMVEDPAGAYVRCADAEAHARVLRDGLHEIAAIVRPLLPVGRRGGAVEQIHDAAGRALAAARRLDSERRVMEREGGTSG